MDEKSKINKNNEKKLPSTEQCKKKSSTKKKRCFFKECNKKIHLFCYTCKYCNHEFCNNHVLPEVHCCKEINSIRVIEVNKLKKKLYSEKTENEKIIKI